LTTRSPLSWPLPQPSLRVGSLGVGVQSTVMALMAAEGEIEPFDEMIFADNRGEPMAVYEHLRFLQSPNVALPFPITTVSAGDLRADVLNSVASWADIGGSNAPRPLWRTAARVANPPFFTRGPATIAKTVDLLPLPLFGIEGGQVEIIVERRTERETFGILRRSCTKEYKIEPITERIRSLLGLARGELGPRDAVVELSIGLTTDEKERLTTSGSRFIHHRHPLCEPRKGYPSGMSRGDCIEWLLRRGIRAPKSRCKFCPFQSNELWRELRDDSPGEFADACEFDHAIRSGIRGTTTKLYLHSERIPLDEVDLDGPAKLWSAEGLRNECQGMCGL